MWKGLGLWCLVPLSYIMVIWKVVPLTIGDNVVYSWGKWTPWTSCSVTCGPGSVQRSRYWYDKNGTKTTATYVQRSSCFLTTKCPINGGWAMWSSMSACSAACGKAQMTRTRECSNPKPAYGGIRCIGSKMEETDCNLLPCPPLPVNFDIRKCRGDGTFWCSSKRMCVTKPQRCDGLVQCHDGSDEYLCNKDNLHTTGIGLHSSWGEWTPLTHCSVTCGYGTIQKTRYWYNENGTRTNQTYVQNTSCYKTCPINGEWTRWSPYSACSAPCGPGVKSRSRTCTNPRPTNGGRDCIGDENENIDCSVQACPELPLHFDLDTCKVDSTYWCRSKLMCVNDSQRCDGEVQCHDGSDEYLCYSNEASDYYITKFLLTILTLFTLVS